MTSKNWKNRETKQLQLGAATDHRCRRVPTSPTPAAACPRVESKKCRVRELEMFVLTCEKDFPSRAITSRRVVGLAIFFAWALACSKIDPGHNSDERRAVPTVTLQHRPNCSPDSGNASQYISLHVAGKERHFFAVPPAGDGKVVDLVIGFHGRGRSGEQVAQSWKCGQSAFQSVGCFFQGTFQRYILCNMLAAC